MSGGWACPGRGVLAGDDNRSIWASLSVAPARLTCRLSTSPSQPSRSASVIRAVRLSRMSASRERWAGSGQSIGQRMQACSWMQAVLKARPQVPVETLRRSVVDRYAASGNALRPVWRLVCPQPSNRQVTPGGGSPDQPGCLDQATPHAFDRSSHPPRPTIAPPWRCTRSTAAPRNVRISSA